MSKHRFTLKIELNCDALPMPWPRVGECPMVTQDLAYAIAEAILVNDLRLEELKRDPSSMRDGMVFTLIAHGVGELEYKNEPT